MSLRSGSLFLKAQSVYPHTYPFTCAGKYQVVIDRWMDETEVRQVEDRELVISDCMVALVLKFHVSTFAFGTVLLKML